ncbi:hypothetical protein ASPCAL14125 [Aspergillus calidoustus]|uniref:Rhodopsin domain-containing protein n=1 Tax=Aspergillus calidoustus TaxID=454130 RepID=A0A0U5CJB0_ASPCI|nr:hypothetical protein ASPCAL14125 [Aspergillus calidoustus]
MYNTTACVITAIILYVLSCILLTLRVYVRFFLLRNSAIDDYIATIAAVTNSALSISYVLGVLRYGLGRDIPSEASQHGLKVILVGELFYFLTTYLAKLSFIFTLFRIVISKAHSYTLYLLTISGAAISIFAWFWVLFFCKPVQYFWEQVVDIEGGGSCKSVSSQGIVITIHAAWVLIADMTLGLGLPILLLWNSKMHRKMRASVYFLLGISSVASIATIVRLVYLPRKPVSDPLMANHPIIFWSIVEAAISIICTAGVTLKPLVVRLGVFGSSRSRTNPEDSSTAVHRWGMHPGPSAWTQAGGRRSIGHSTKWYGEPLELETRSMPGSPADEMGAIVVRTEIHLHRDHY